MAIYRNVSMSFWTDSKIADDFTPDDKYFYLYLFTNPHTNLCGCYEISIKQMAYETGLSANKVKSLIERLSVEHDVIRYNAETRELILINWYRYNWTESDKFRKPLLREIKYVKYEPFRKYLLDMCEGEDQYPIDTVSIPYGYGSDTLYCSVSVPVSDTDTVSVPKKDYVKETAKEIIDYLNEITGQHYKSTTKETLKLIRARLSEGATIDDFRTVIYKKTNQWKEDPKMSRFLRPQTLFGTKFESYLNEIEPVKKGRLDWVDEAVMEETSDGL